MTQRSADTPKTGTRATTSKTGVSRRFLTRLAVFVAIIGAAITAGFFVASSPSSAQTCNYSGGTTDCNGWSFDYFLASGSVSPTGLTLRNVEFNGEQIMFQANFAGLPVKYDGDACGPYVDLFSTLTNSDPVGIQADTFTQNGENWLEMGVHYQIGQYILYTAYYFGENGEMEMRIFARGIECPTNHQHFPIFVMDVDLEGVPTISPTTGNILHGPGDEIYYKSGNNWIQQTSEADNQVNQLGHEWIVRDPDSTLTVQISHDSGTFGPPSGSTNAPQGGANNIVYTRESGPLRELAWPGAPTNGGRNFLNASGYNNGQWGYNDGQTITDPVIAVRSVLDHAVAPGLPDDWHTSGINLRVVPDPLFVAPPTATATSTPTSTPTPTPTSTATPTSTSTPTPTPTTEVPPQSCVLADGVATTGLAGGEGAEIQCTIVVPANTQTLEVVMTGAGDADLYTRFGNQPTTTTWDCRPYVDGSSDEVCTIQNPAAGTHHVMVRGWAAFSNVSLTGSVINGGSGNSGGCVLANGVAETGLSGAEGTELRCEVVVPAGATNLQFTTTGSGDADLYVNAGAPPSVNVWECRPFADGTSAEECDIANAVAGTYHVMVRGWAAFSNVSLTASWDTGGSGTSNGVPITGLNGTAGSEQFFTFTVPSGTSTFTVELAGGVGDGDLYTRFGAAPSIGVWDCRPYLDGTNDETCTISNPTPGTYHVMVRGWADFSGASLTATAS